MKSNLRYGVASVIGTIFFIFIFIAALGALAYMISLQVQSGQIIRQELQIINQKGAEHLTYSTNSSGLYVTNNGPATSKIVAVILEFTNGTVYNLQQTAYLPSGDSVNVQSLIPSGNCGGSTCQSVYNSIVSGATPGMVGLVTSFGNKFIYTS